MPRKPKPPPDDPEQFKRFTDMAREVGADTDPETLGRVFDKVAQSPKSPSPKPKTVNSVSRSRSAPPPSSPRSRKRPKKAAEQ